MDSPRFIVARIIDIHNERRKAAFVRSLFEAAERAARRGE